MRMRIWNNDSTDSCEYEADTIEEIKEMCESRIALDSWKNGWSEVIDEN